MGKGTKIVGSVAKSVILKPIFDQMRKEVRLETKRHNSLLNQASLDVLAERAAENNPRIWDVRQPFDAIIHEHRLW